MKKAFTLVGLLFTVAIIAVLMDGHVESMTKVVAESRFTP